MFALSGAGWPAFLPAVAQPPASISNAAQLRHAVELRNRGYTVIRDAGLASLIDKARKACADEFASLQDAVSQLGIDRDDLYAFAEIETRHRLRTCFRPSSPSAWTELVDTAVGASTPIIELLQTLPPHPDDSVAGDNLVRQLVPTRPTIDQVDVLLSQPGCKAQKFHADAGVTHLQWARMCSRHRLFNVFVPLVDIEKDSDGTQLWPGSHLGTCAVSYTHLTLPTICSV